MCPCTRSSSLFRSPSNPDDSRASSRSSNCGPAIHHGVSARARLSLKSVASGSSRTWRMSGAGPARMRRARLSPFAWLVEKSMGVLIVPTAREFSHTRRHPCRSPTRSLSSWPCLGVIVGVMKCKLAALGQQLFESGSHRTWQRHEDVASTGRRNTTGDEVGPVRMQQSGWLRL
jgi:hypothetical protein